MIRFEPGTVYDVAHLKPFDLPLALAGHPLATKHGRSVRHLRQMDNGDRIIFGFDEWDEPGWIADCYFLPKLAQYLRLAPLCVRDGRPLHVRDEIEVSIVVSGGGCEWTKIGATIKGHLSGFYKDHSDQWRWPV